MRRAALNACGDAWIRWLVLLVVMVLTKAIEVRLATTAGQPNLNVYALPFLAGMAVLPVLQEGLLGLIFLAIATSTAYLTPEFASHDAIQRLPVQVVGVGLCLWASHLRTRLAQNRDLLQSIISGTPVGIAICHSGNHRIAMVNPAMVRLLQIPQQQLIGRRWDRLAGPLPSPGESRRQSIRGRAAVVEAEVCTSMLPKRAQGETLVLVQALDISQRVATEQALANEHAQLQQAMQACLKGVTLVHELRQPLAVLLLQCRELLMLQEQAASDDDALSEGLRQLYQTAQQIDAITATISGLLRSANRSNHQPVNLTTLLGNLIADVRSKLESNSVELICQGLDQPVRINGDQGQLRIAISNVLRNALEALQERPASQRRLLIQLESRGSDVLLTIADSGPGLPSLDVDALQLRSSKSDGLGLGLFTAAMVTNNHAGRLQLGISPKLGGAEICLSLGTSAARPQANSG
ncbi:MAG: sensor histidine kinase [Synechococcaceae bacterium WB9_2_112]|nr:sensor histidine kinase [Synechococcaceae bacterium WB9_2_112]